MGRLHPWFDDKAAEQKLIYALTNPVKDNLIETVSQSPFFSMYHHQAFGDELRFWYLDYTTGRQGETGRRATA